MVKDGSTEGVGVLFSWPAVWIERKERERVGGVHEQTKRSRGYRFNEVAERLSA